MTTETLYFPVGNIFTEVREDSANATKTIETIPLTPKPATWESLDEDIVTELMLWDRVSDYDLQYLEQIAEQLADEQG